MAAMSAEPARTCAVAARPARARRRGLGARSARSKARKTQGIHDAPVKWCQRLTSERKGPDAVQAAAATKAGARSRPQLRASAYWPKAVKRQWNTTNAV
jgi:hypothetical protein